MLRKYLIRGMGALGAGLLLLASVVAAHAQGEPIRLLSSSVTSEFPEGMRFKAEIDAEGDISSVAVRLRIGQQARGVYEYLELDKGRLVNSELLWRTNSSGRYIPPGTIITYNFEIEDDAGNRLDTEQEEFIYHDARFEWEEVSEGVVSVAYHGPVKTRAEIVLNAILQTLEVMGPILGADTTVPIRVTMYNNVKEMLEALPPGSTTIRRELITEGQAFTRIGTLLVLGSGSLAEGTASHEVIHILTHRAGDSVFRTVPSWLNEGLAEYGNIQPGFSYDIALEFAQATGRLMPITAMNVLPGNPEDVIIFYGEARSIVRFMIGRFGPEKMRELMATLKSGKSVDDALQEVYGFDRLGLENRWREFLGAPEFVPPETGRAAPTPISRREFLPYSLTPQPQSATVSGMEEATPTPEPPTATPTPSPEPTATPPPEPSPTPEPEPSPTSQPPSESIARLQQATPAPEREEPAREQETEGGGGGGAACGAPAHRGPLAVDISALGLALGLVGLGVRRRFSRR